MAGKKSKVPKGDFNFSSKDIDSDMFVPEKAIDIMKYGVITVPKKASVYEAISVLVSRGYSGLPVVDETGMVGMISEKDVLQLLYDTHFSAGVVEEFMTKNVISFSPEDMLIDICECFMKSDFRRVTILHHGRLIGIVSRADMIRAHKDRFKPEVTTKHEHIFMAEDVMQCGLMTVKRKTPIYEVMNIMAKRQISGLPVVDDYMNLEGIITEKDIMKLLYDPHAKSGVVEDHMSEEVISFNREDNLFDVCDCLINNIFHRVTIVEGSRLVGIISRADIISYILKNRTAINKARNAEMPCQAACLS